MKDKGFLILFVVNIILFIADIVTTLMNGSLIQYLEANPLYQFVGIPGIVVLNILFFSSIWFLYKVKNARPITRFTMINLLLILTLVRLYALNNNIYWLRNPVTVEQVQQLDLETSKKVTVKVISWLAYFPLFMTQITYWFFKLDHKIEKK